MNGGYAMVDCSGLVLTKGTNQTIAGIWEQVDAAYKSGKAVWAHNCEYNNGMLSPVPVMILNESATEYIATSSILQISVKNNDVCRVISLLG